MILRKPYVHLKLPRIKALPRVMSYQDFGFNHDSMRISWLNLSILTCNLREWLKTPEAFITALKEAYDLHEQAMRSITAPRYCYRILPGLRQPMTKSPLMVIDASDNFLTVVAEDMTDGFNPVACNQYILIEEHKRILKTATKEAVDQLQTIVAAQVKSGVQDGVSRAIEKQVTTFYEIQDERQKIKIQQVELERQLAQLDGIEQRLNKERLEQSKSARKGYVYILKQVNGEYYKIGRTNNPKSRAKTFGVLLPFDVEYEHVIQTDDMYTLESDLHIRFQQKRVNGEWFALDADDLAWIKAIDTANGHQER